MVGCEYILCRKPEGTSGAGEVLGGVFVDKVIEESGEIGGGLNAAILGAQVAAGVEGVWRGRVPRALAAVGRQQVDARRVLVQQLGAGEGALAVQAERARGRRRHGGGGGGGCQARQQRPQPGQRQLARHAAGAGTGTGTGCPAAG